MEPERMRTLRLMAIAAALAVILTVVGVTAYANYVAWRIKKNEEAVVAACRAFCSAQNTFRRKDYDQDGEMEYAQVLHGDRPPPRNTPPWKEGEPVPPGVITKPTLGLYIVDKSEFTGLISREIAEAEEGPGAVPYNGYYFRVLTHFRNPTTGEVESYIDSSGRMTIGYSLLAYPAEYGSSGMTCFQVNVQGIVYPKDFGSAEATQKAIEEVGRVFDPHATDPKKFWGSPG